MWRVSARAAAAPGGSSTSRSRWRRARCSGFCPNGAGKTTTVWLLMTLLRADAGVARIARLDCWRDSLAFKRLVGYAPGEPSLDPDLTGGQTLEYLGHLRWA